MKAIVDPERDGFHPVRSGVPVRGRRTLFARGGLAEGGPAVYWRVMAAILLN